MAKWKGKSKILRQVFEKAGGIASLGRQLGIKGQAISQWERVPDRWVLDVERLTGISRRELRPDRHWPETEAAAAVP